MALDPKNFGPEIVVAVHNGVTTACVTIPLPEYNGLLADQRKLSALEANGVDNWDYYDIAMASLDE
jgi:hypothetical protein